MKFLSISLLEDRFQQKVFQFVEKSDHFFINLRPQVFDSIFHLLFH